MAKSATWANELLLLLFNNTDAANIGDAAGLQNSAAAGSLYVALHTGDPSAGTQATSAATYTGYARQAVARSGAGWTVTAGAVTNAAAVTFPACSSGGDSLTHWSVGKELAGATAILYSGALTGAPVVVSTVNTPPSFAIGELDITEA